MHGSNQHLQCGPSKTHPAEKHVFHRVWRVLAAGLVAGLAACGSSGEGSGNSQPRTQAPVTAMNPPQTENPGNGGNPPAAPSQPAPPSQPTPPAAPSPPSPPAPPSPGDTGGTGEESEDDDQSGGENGSSGQDGEQSGEGPDDDGNSDDGQDGSEQDDSDSGDTSQMHGMEVIIPRNTAAIRSCSDSALSSLGDYKYQWGLCSIRADEAIDQTQLSEGNEVEVKIGIIDTDIYTDHPVFRSMEDGSEYPLSLLRTVEKTTPLDDNAPFADRETRESHGTAVASVAAGAYSSASPPDNLLSNFLGVAPGASIVGIAVCTGDTCPDESSVSFSELNGALQQATPDCSDAGNAASQGCYDPISAEVLVASANHWKADMEKILDVGDGSNDQWRLHNSDALENLRIINVSLGVEGIIDDYDLAPDSDLRRCLYPFVRVVAQLDDGEAPVPCINLSDSEGGEIPEPLADNDEINDDPVLVVWAGGNSNGSPCLTSSSKHCQEHLQGATSNRQDCSQLSDAKSGSASATTGRIIACHPEVLPGLISEFDVLKRNSVVAVALARNLSEDSTELYEASNQCGKVWENCITAPGEYVLAAGYGWRLKEDELDESNDKNYDKGVESFVYYSGTSVAAPMVSGGLAQIMLHFRDTLPSTEVLRRLLLTANQSPPFNNREIYGRGLMDLRAATNAYGTASISTDNSVDSPGASLRSTRLALGAAFGAASPQSLSGNEIVAFDELGAPFWHSLESLITVRQSPTLTEQVRSLFDGERFTDTQHSLVSSEPANTLRLELVDESEGYWGVAGDSLEITWTSQSDRISASAFTSDGGIGNHPATGATLSWKPLGLSAGLLDERDSALGVTADGGFGNLSARTLFAGFDGGRYAGPWRLSAEAKLGIINPDIEQGLIVDMPSMTASRFSINAARNIDRFGSVSLSLEQPLRVESARAAMRIPVSRSKSGDVLYKHSHADLAPTGRQLDLSAYWARPFWGGGTIQLGAVYSEHPGHIQDSSPSLSLVGGYRLEY